MTDQRADVPAEPGIRRIEVSAGELVAALRLIAAAEDRSLDVALTYEENALHIYRGHTHVSVPSSGSWSRVAMVNRQLVLDLLDRAAALPEIVVLTGGEAQLTFSHYSIRCRWRDAVTVGPAVEKYRKSRKIYTRHRRD